MSSPSLEFHPPPAARPLVPRATLRATAVCAALGALLAVARAEWRSLPAALAARGLRVEPGSVSWLDPPGLSARRALLLARRGDEPTDVYVVTARTGPGDRVISLRDVSNLTRSRDASEEALLVSAGERFAAFATRVGDEVVAFNVLDTRGDRSEAPVDRGARMRLAVTHLQQTGSTRGYGVDRFDLRHPARAVRLALRDGYLEVRDEVARAPRSVRVVLADDGPRVAAGEEHVRVRPRTASQQGAWVTWAVDTVRAIPWVGSEPIAWLETWAFRAQHVAARAAVAVGGDARARQEAAEDLQDVLAAARSGAGAALEGPVEQWPPAPLRGSISPPLDHEGVWEPVASADDPFVRTIQGAPMPMYLTFVRTDDERPDSRTFVLVWDPRMIELHVAPGSEEPMGATGETGTGAIPRDVRTMERLVGAFNGAFQAIHGEFGVFAEGTLLLPAKPYAATVALLADGSTGFGSWPANSSRIPDEVLEFRQNLTGLVDGAVFNPWRRGFWGGLVNNATDLHTTRSALCLTREGYVAYFWGQTLTPRTLGDALLAARCEYGMHLDMNGTNTGFELYRAGRAESHAPLTRAPQSGYEIEGAVSGLPGVTFRARKLVRRMSHNLSRYIRRDPRDFFYLLARAVLPGAPLRAPVSPPQPGEGSWHVAGLAATPFPWPMARTRVRPDATRPERWVNLVRVDPRRVSFAPVDAPGNARVIARVMNAPLAQPGQLRVSMSTGPAGARWSIGTEGDGLAGEPLRAGMSALRGACIDGDGFLVFAVADRAERDLLWRALELAGCGAARVSLSGAVLALENGQGAAGESVPAGATPTVLLTERAFVGARRIFSEVVPVAPSVWQPAQHRQVRYTRNPDDGTTMQVHLVGQQSPVIIPMRGVSRDAGVAPSGAPGASSAPH